MKQEIRIPLLLSLLLIFISAEINPAQGRTVDLNINESGIYKNAFNYTEEAVFENGEIWIYVYDGSNLIEKYLFD